MTASLTKDDWKFDGNFVDVGRVAVDAWESVARSIPDERWCTQRPDTHLAEYLEPIVLVQDEMVDPMVGELGLAALLAPILRVIAARYGAGIPALVSLVRLRAHTTIPHHRDGPATRPAVCTRRTHTPIVTNERVVFEVRGERRHMARGEIVEINNWRDHGVVNDGDEDRIHLIVDWAPFAPEAMRI